MFVAYCILVYTLQDSHLVQLFQDSECLAIARLNETTCNFQSEKQSNTQ